MLLAALKASEENQEATVSCCRRVYFIYFCFTRLGFGKREWTAAASLTVATHG